MAVDIKPGAGWTTHSTPRFEPPQAPSHNRSAPAPAADAPEGHIGLAQLEPSDGERLRRLFYRLSPESLYRRFMSPVFRPEQVRPDRLLDVDHLDREAIVAVEDDEIIGVARYVRQPGAEAAELAVVVADAWHHKGIATRMLRALAERAAAAGIASFTMVMLCDNRPVVQLVRQAYPSVRFAMSSGVCETAVPVDAWRQVNAPPR